MARKRMLDPSIWTDDGMAELTPRQQLLYIGLISNADDEGRLKGNATALRLVLPGIYGQVDDREIDIDLDAVLGNMRKLQRYIVAGRPYLVFHNYATWQKIKSPSASILPSPDEHDSGNDSETMENQCGNDSASRAIAGALLETEVKRKEEKGKEENPRGRAREEPDKPARARTVANDMWDAFSRELGAEPKTKSERGKWNGAIKELVDAEITPEEVPRLVTSYRRVYKDIDCNPRAIANNLSTLMTKNGSRASPQRDRAAESAQFAAYLAEEEAKLDETS